MNKKLGKAGLVLLLVSLFICVPLPVCGKDIQFIQEFHIRSSFDCWRNEKGEWTLELGGQGAQVLGVPGEYVDYIIPYPIPSEFHEAELVLEEASWEVLSPKDPYYAESIPWGEVLDVFLSDDQELCIRVRTKLEATIAPEDITQNWQDPPILGLRYIVPLVVEVRGAHAIPDAQGDIVFVPNSSEDADGSVRGWYNKPLSVQVSYQGEKPFESYQENAFEYVWTERMYTRTMLDMGYSPWQRTEEQTIRKWLPRKGKFWLSPSRLRVEAPEQTYYLRDGRKLVLDTETFGFRLTGQVYDYDSLFAGYALPQADVRGSLNDTYYLAPEYGSYEPQEQPVPQFPEIIGTSGIYRLDFTPPVIDLIPQNKGWYNKKLDLELYIEPDLSGLYQTQCEIKDLSMLGNPTRSEIWWKDDYPEKISLEQEGVYQIVLHSEDLAGNIQQKEYGLFLLDFTAPCVSEITISGVPIDQAPSRISYSDKLLLGFKANDNLSGLETVEYAFCSEKNVTNTEWRKLSFLEQDDFMSKHELNFEVSLEKAELGEGYVQIHLVDKAGNETYQEFGPVSMEGIRDFRVLYLSDPRWERLFLDRETVNQEILWRGLKLEDFQNLQPKGNISQNMLPIYRTKDRRGFHAGYVLIAEFEFFHPDFEDLLIEDRFYYGSDQAYEPLDLIIPGEDFCLETKKTNKRIRWTCDWQDQTYKVLVRYAIPANAIFSTSIQEDLSVEKVRDIRQKEPIQEVLVALDIWLEKDGVKLCSWKTDCNQSGIVSFWYGSSKKQKALPSGALCWLDLNGSAYSDLEKRFP